jgi:thymidylate kinase
LPLSNITPTDPAVREQLAHGLDDPVPPDTLRLAHFIASAFGPTARALIHYGSHAQRSGAGPESAHDFFVIVDRYADAYRALQSAGALGAAVRTATALAHILPPNVHRVIAPLAPHQLQAKCAVLSARAFEELCSPRAKDHFTQGRLFQKVQIAWSRDPASHESTRNILIDLRANTYRWGHAFLPQRFDTETYFRQLLETSFAAEIRPEANERIGQLIDAQSATVVPAYDALLEHLTASRILLREGKVYRSARPATRMERLAIRAYFARSKARATARWSKHVALYDDWLDYIVQKISRRTGVDIELTERERRWPLIFLWPRAIQFVRSRPQRRQT